jgi:hypothetical protein
MFDIQPEEDREYGWDPIEGHGGILDKGEGEYSDLAMDLYPRHREIYIGTRHIDLEELFSASDDAVPKAIIVSKKDESISPDFLTRNRGFSKDGYVLIRNQPTDHQVSMNAIDGQLSVDARPLYELVEVKREDVGKFTVPVYNDIEDWERDVVNIRPENVLKGLSDLSIVGNNQNTGTLLRGSKVVKNSITGMFNIDNNIVSPPVFVFSQNQSGQSEDKELSIYSTGSNIVIEGVLKECSIRVTFDIEEGITKNLVGMLLSEDIPPGERVHRLSQVLSKSFIHIGEDSPGEEYEFIKSMLAGVSSDDAVKINNALDMPVLSYSTVEQKWSHPEGEPAPLVITS